MLRFVRRDYEHSNQLLLRHWTLWVVTLGAGVSNCRLPLLLISSAV